MSIGPSEILILLIVLLGVILISRHQTKRICPKCGFVLRSYSAACSECGMVFPKKKRVGGKSPRLVLFI